MKKNKIVPVKPDPDIKDEQEDIDNQNFWMSPGGVVVVNSYEELAQLLSQITGGNMSQVTSDMQLMLGHDQFPDNLTPEQGQTMSGPDVWGPSFRGDSRDVHVFNGNLTAMPRSVYDRVH